MKDQFNFNTALIVALIGTVGYFGQQAVGDAREAKATANTLMQKTQDLKDRMDGLEQRLDTFASEREVEEIRELLKHN